MTESSLSSRGQRSKDTSDTFSCQGCGAAIPYSGRGRKPKWCSGRCRKASYGDPCVTCGARTNYGAEKARVPEPHCDDCMREIRSSRRVGRVLAMLALRRQGMTNLDIAASLDIPVKTVNAELHRLRILGYQMPAVKRGAPYIDGDRASSLEAEVLGRELAKRGHYPDQEAIQNAA